MTSHELAQRLLDGPDLLVFVEEIASGELWYVQPEPDVHDARVWADGTASETTSADEDAVKVIVL